MGGQGRRGGGFIDRDHRRGEDGARSRWKATKQYVFTVMTKRVQILMSPLNWACGSVRGGQWRLQRLAVAGGGAAAGSMRRRRGQRRDRRGARERRARCERRGHASCRAARRRALLTRRWGAAAGGPRGPFAARNRHVPPPGPVLGTCDVTGPCHDNGSSTVSSDGVVYNLMPRHVISHDFSRPCH